VRPKTVVFCFVFLEKQQQTHFSDKWHYFQKVFSNNIWFSKSIWFVTLLLYWPQHSSCM